MSQRFNLPPARPVTDPIGEARGRAAPYGVAIGLSNGAAQAEAFAPDRVLAAPIVHHRIWVMTCTPEMRPIPIRDARDNTLQIKSEGGRPRTGEPPNRSRQQRSSSWPARRDQRRLLIVTFRDPIRACTRSA